MAHLQVVNMDGKPKQQFTERLNPYSGPAGTLHRPFHDREQPFPKDGHPDYNVGDMVVQPVHGIGKVVSMEQKGADFEVAILFEGTKRTRKYIATFSRIVKYDPEKHDALHKPKDDNRLKL